MILPGQAIRAISPHIVQPFCERTVIRGRSYGLSHAGYDIRIKQSIFLFPQRDRSMLLSFSLASSIERFQMPNDVLGIVHDKSSWARVGIAVQNTVIEPGWCGHLTLEITNHGPEAVELVEGDPIAQVIFHRLEAPAEKTYTGKYQNQPDMPIPAKLEQ
jgi:dCTP deaminase